MTNRGLLLTGIAISMVACAVSATRWAESCKRTAELTRQLEGMRPAPPLQTTAVPSPSATPIESSGPSTELDERKALLAEARAIPELARREAALVIIRRIQARHQEAPPASRPLPPFYCTKDGTPFPELLHDPVYLSLVREEWRTGIGGPMVASLSRLGIPEDLQEQILAIEFDDYLSTTEPRNYETNEERQAALEEHRRIRQENAERRRALLGEAAHEVYMSGRIPSPAPSQREQLAGMIATYVNNGKLARRLSYSNSPLSETDSQRLQEVVASKATSLREVMTLLNDPEFLGHAQSVLNATQLDALRQVQEENEARMLRSRLPKSSELPRTTRRARLEAGK